MGIDADKRTRLKERILGYRALRTASASCQQILLEDDLSRDVVATLETHAARAARHRRGADAGALLPVRQVGAHLLGYMREVDAEGLARLRRAPATARAIASAPRHRARAGRATCAGSAAGRRSCAAQNAPRRQRTGSSERSSTSRAGVEPIPGRDLSLTIDIELQKAIDSARCAGSSPARVVVVDVRTGRSSRPSRKPSFDPNALSGGSGKKAIRDAFRRLNRDPLKPLLDKTISGAYPPGSTFKPFTALAALEDGLIDPNAEVECKRRLRVRQAHLPLHARAPQGATCTRPSRSRATSTSTSSPRRSAWTSSPQVGIDFGFGAKTGIGINPEARGRMPTRAWYTRRYKGQFRVGFTLNAAIGQGATTVTVLQLALAYAALANGGTLYQPQLVRSVETSAGTVVQEFPPRVRRMIDVGPEHLALIKERSARRRERDRGHRLQRVASRDVDVAGKTGTAQVSHVTPRGVDPERVWYFNRDHAWFAGYAPANSPEIAIVVLVEHGGGGGKNAAPVAMRVVDAWQKLNAKRRLAQRGPEPARRDGAHL